MSPVLKEYNQIKAVKRYSFIPIIIAIILAGIAIPQLYQLHEEYSQQRQRQEDYAEITKLDYGLFNMQLWKEKSIGVFTDNISEFEISDAAYGDVKVELRKYLYNVYDEYIATGKIFNQIFEDAEKEGKVNKILLKMIKSNVSEQIEKLNIKSYIPSMAEQMAKELEKNEPRLKEIMQSELKKLVTFEEKYPVKDPRLKIFQRYEESDLEGTISQINELSAASRQRLDGLIKNSFGLLLVGALLCIIGILMRAKKSGVVVLTLISVTFLILGIFLPMIEIDARLNSFVFSLFNQDLSFGEQTMFYQSKSITDITTTLMESKGFDLKLVGALIFAFSILFPLLKLLLTSVYVFSDKAKNSRIIQTIIFNLGKWSMADVFVVAMFMAYIGFYGLVDSQLQMIESNRGGFGIETINYSKLAPGALFFTTYCLLSIISSYFVKVGDEKLTST